MRAMIESGIVPSAIIGSRKVAQRVGEDAPLAGEQRVHDRHVRDEVETRRAAAR